MLSPADVARLANVSLSTVRREIDRGELRARHVGRQLRIDPAEFRAYLGPGGIRMSGVIEMRPADGTRLEVRGRDASFVATKTITVRNEYGKDETLTAGATFIHDARHFLVTEYPHLFAREGRPGRAPRPHHIDAPSQPPNPPAPTPSRPNARAWCCSTAASRPSR